MLVKDLLAKVLRLPRSERARLAEQVLLSLEEPDDEAAGAWASELEGRSLEVAEGGVQTVSGILREPHFLRNWRSALRPEHSA